MAAKLRLVDERDTARPSDPFLDELLEEMAGGQARPSHLALEDEPVLERTTAQREAGVRAVERALLAEKKGASRRKQSFAALAVAAAIGMGWLVGADPLDAELFGSDPGVASLLEQKGTVLYRGIEGTWGDFPESKTISAGAGVRTEMQASARVQTPWGVDVSLTEETTIAFPAADSEFMLEDSTEGRVVELLAGRVELSVPPLGVGETFAVHAADYQVVVHGTQFSVQMREEGAAPCVMVRRGVVEVRGPEGETWLRAGQEAGCQLPTDVVDEPEEEAGQRQQGSQKASAPRTKTSKAWRSNRPSVASKKTSSLAEQNRLFQSALASERAGDWGSARSQLDSLLSRFPDSPLAGQAKAQRRSIVAREREERSLGQNPGGSAKPVK